MMLKSGGHRLSVRVMCSVTESRTCCQKSNLEVALAKGSRNSSFHHLRSPPRHKYSIRHSAGPMTHFPLCPSSLLGKTSFFPTSAINANGRAMNIFKVGEVDERSLESMCAPGRCHGQSTPRYESRSDLLSKVPNG